MFKLLHHLFYPAGVRPPLLLRALHRAHVGSPLLAALSLVTGCMLAPAEHTAAPPPTPSTWEQLAPGLERRTIAPGAPLVSFMALRIDPAVYTLRAHYNPGAPLDVSEWRQRLPDAVAFINANFFDRAGFALGLVIADGMVYGETFRDRGGMVYVANGAPGVRSTLIEPYYVGEPLEQAAQAFPMLVTGGRTAFTNPRGDYAARRTLVGEDAQGRIVFMVSSSLFGMRLTDLSAYLPATDLGLVDAVNLDGGGSSLMALYPPSGSASIIPSFDPVPVVIAVYAR